MMDLAELSRELGISIPAARRRLEALLRYLNGHLDGKVTRGPRGKLLLNESVAALLRDAENLARERGITFAEALQVVAGGHNGMAEPSREVAATVTEKTETVDQAKILARAILIGAGLVAGSIVVAGMLIALALRV